MTIRLAMVGVTALVATAVLAAAAPALAFDVAAVYPGCAQERGWCERAASVSYGDPARFRNALTAVVAVEWLRAVRAAEKAASINGYEMSSPSVQKVTDDLIEAWRVGSSCCDVTLNGPLEDQAATHAGNVPNAAEYEKYCLRAEDGSRPGNVLAQDCLSAVKSAQPAHQ